MPQAHGQVLLLTSEEQLPRGNLIWGTVDGVPPAAREALDWLTLVRALGWSLSVSRATGAFPENQRHDQRFVIIATDVDRLGQEMVDSLRAYLENEPIFILSRAAAKGCPLAALAGVQADAQRVSGTCIQWTGPPHSCRWHSQRPLEGASLRLAKDVQVWARLDGVPFVVARRVGRGVIATLSFQPSETRDRDATGTSLLRHLLIHGPGSPVSWLNFDSSVILRMDDAGGAQNVFLESWCYPKLSRSQWAETCTALERENARMSIGYISGWVDDGDRRRGQLEIAGQAVERVPGNVHPAPLVTYRDYCGHAPGRVYCYRSEYQGIQTLRQNRLGDVELHGYTHIHPDTKRWARAWNRYRNANWYYDLRDTQTTGQWLRKRLASLSGRAAERPPPGRDPLESAFKVLRQYFGASPTTLICPQSKVTTGALRKSLDLGLHLVSSHPRLALRVGSRFCWTSFIHTTHVQYPDRRLFAGGLPVIALFHDRDLALEGIPWFRRCLEEWRSAGVTRFIDFREYAAALKTEVTLRWGESPTLEVVTDPASPPVRPLPVGIYIPDKHLPNTLTVVLNGSELSSKIVSTSTHCGEVLVPADTDCTSGTPQER